MAAVQLQRAPNDPRPVDDPRIDLSEKLQAVPYYLPNLKLPYKDWPHTVNPNYSQLKVALDARIKEYVHPKKNYRLFKRLN